MNARSPIWPALLSGLALALGLCGIRWGLPSRARRDLVMPLGSQTAAYQQKLIESWAKMHERFGSDIMVSPESWAAPFTGVQRVPPGWTEPPPLLQNSVRSFYLRSAHEDEQSTLIVLSRMRPWRLELNPHLFTYGGTYIYSLGAWLALGARLHVAHLHTSMAPYMADPGQMASLYFTGRLFTLACYIGCALMLLRIGRRDLGAEAGLFAALFFILCPGVVVQSHVLKNHMLWAFLILCTLDLSLVLLATGGLAAYAAAGAASGLAVGAFLQAWPGCFVVGFACLLRIAAPRRPAAPELERPGRRRRVERRGVSRDQPVLAVGLEVGARRDESAHRLEHFRRDASAARAESFVHERRSRGRILALVLAGGVAAFVKGRREPALCLTLFAFLAGLAMTMTLGGVLGTRQVRYFLGFLAVGQLLAGRVAADLLRWKSPRRPWILAALALVLANLALTGSTYAYNFHADAGERSTHVESGAWIEAHVPPGSSIGMLRLPQPSNAPYFHYGRYDLRFIASAAFFAVMPAAELPQYLAVTSPDYDDRPAMEPNLSRYELAAEFERSRIVPWITIDPTATTANPLIDIYRLKEPR